MNKKKMTKKEMIEKIQKAEHHAWEELTSVRKMWGKDDNYTYHKGFAWCALNDLLKTLGVKDMRELELTEIGG